MSTSTMKELCERATKFAPGFVPKSHAECVGVDTAGHARQKISARLSPATVLRVVEALEYIASGDAMDPTLVANNALRLLDGQDQT